MDPAGFKFSSESIPVIRALEMPGHPKQTQGLTVPHLSREPYATGREAG